MSLMNTGSWPLVLDPTSAPPHRRGPRRRHLRHHDQRSPPRGIKKQPFTILVTANNPLISNSDHQYKRSHNQHRHFIIYVVAPMSPWWAPSELVGLPIITRGWCRKPEPEIMQIINCRSYHLGFHFKFSSGPAISVFSASFTDAHHYCAQCL